MKMIIKDRSRTMRHVSRTHRAALDVLFDRFNLDPKMQIKYVDTKKQRADMLTKGRFTKDEGNHLLRLLNIMNFSTFYCSHFSHFLSDPPRKQKTVSKGGQEGACEFNQGQGETHELGVSARNSSVQNWVTPTNWRMRRRTCLVSQLAAGNSGEHPQAWKQSKPVKNTSPGIGHSGQVLGLNWRLETRGPWR